jgi:sulfate transport system ATP-binding protein
MTFVGAVSRLGDAYVRPHDLELTLHPNGMTERATVERVVYLGFEVRVELELARGERVVAQATPAQADELGLHDGQTLFVRPSRTKTFEPA